MYNTEKLRKTICALVTMLRVGKHLTYAGKELDSVLDINNYNHKDYDSDKRTYSEARTSFDKLANIVCNAIGGDVYSDAEKEFLLLFNNKAAVKEVLGTENTDNPKKKFEEIFFALKETIDITKDNDDFSLWLSAADDVLNKQQIKEIVPTTLCPYCEEFVERVPYDVVFGDNSSSSQFVYYCEGCGAYAFANKEGQMIGCVADKETHNKRKMAKSAVSDMTNFFGLTYSEAFRYFSRVVGVKMNEIRDIEKLNIEKCSLIISDFINLKDRYNKNSINWPKKHKELMKFLSEGGRLKIIRSLRPERNNRLLIPIAVGEGVMMVKGNLENEKVLLPPVLKYKFNKDILEIIHPNKKEYFKMYPKFEG